MNKSRGGCAERSHEGTGGALGSEDAPLPSDDPGKRIDSKQAIERQRLTIQLRRLASGRLWFKLIDQLTASREGGLRDYACRGTRCHDGSSRFCW